MSKKVLVPIADGVEEIETVCIIDVLRRAGAAVTVASVGECRVTASRGVVLVADRRLADCHIDSIDEPYDLIVLPGGMPGAEHLRDSQDLIARLKRQRDENRLYGAICASPAVVFRHHGLLNSRRATCHPNFAEQLGDAEHIEARVVVDGNCITSRAPGTAIEFALKLVELLFGPQKAEEVAKPLLIAAR